MIDTIHTIVHDTILHSDSVLVNSIDKIFTIARINGSWNKIVDLVTVLVSAISLGIAFLVFKNQKKKSELDEKAFRYQALSQQPNLVIKEKILIGANDSDGVHLRLWNNGLGIARLTRVRMTWDGREIKNIGSLAASVSLNVTTDAVTQTKERIYFGLYELKSEQAISPNEGFRILEAIGNYREYIDNFTEVEIGIRNHLAIEIEYESLFSIKGKPIRFPEDRTDYIIDARKYVPSQLDE